jgi:hypothetical protein
MRRPTSLRVQPESSNANARLRRSSNRSELPFNLGIGVLPLNTYYCILYAEINNPRCPMLLFSNQIADELNEFFKQEE